MLFSTIVSEDRGTDVENWTSGSLSAMSRTYAANSPFMVLIVCTDYVPPSFIVSIKREALVQY